MKPNTITIHVDANTGKIEVETCAWCWPKAQMIRRFPVLEGIPSNHGICTFHQQELHDEYAALVVANNRAILASL